VSAHAFRRQVRSVITFAVIGVIALLPASAPLTHWHVYAFRDGAFRLVMPTPSLAPSTLTPSQSPALPRERLGLRPDWRVTASALADVTGDDLPEWVLVVWRPWRDWPIQSWSPAPSPIAQFHDAAGNSCHLILLNPHDGRQIWAGSAMPTPLMSLAAGDVDGDSQSEVVALEGDYATPRNGPASSVVVWKWNGFGFSLEWRSPPGHLRQLWLTNAEGDSILDIVAR
jgi:hypothetical protein